MAESIHKIKVLGMPLAATDYSRAIAQAKTWATETGQPRSVAAAASHLVTLARSEPAFGEVMTHFDLILPDGMPLVWVMNQSLDEPLRDRVYGPTFMLKCLEATQGEPWQHLFIGGSNELLAALRTKLLERFPDLRIAGTYSPPFGTWPAEEDNRIIEMIRNSPAQFIWFGLGCPKQETWVAKNKHLLPAKVYATVGAAFAFHAGRVQQAPPWMQRRGMEWIFRLFSEPKRLWKRYLVYNSLFVYYLVRDRLAGSH